MARWAVVTYSQSTDRAAEARELASGLRDRGLAVGGFVQEKHAGPEGGARFELCRLGSAERLTLGSTGDPSARKPDSDGGCSFTFRSEGFAAARGWLEEDAPGSRVLFISEVSKLEAGGEGHHAALCWALGLPAAKLVVFVAKAVQLSYLIEKLAPPGEPVAYLELPAASPAKEAFLDALAGVCLPTRFGPSLPPHQ